MPADLEIRLLGPIEVFLEGHATPLGGPRAAALLALLTLRLGESVPVDRLIEDLWAGDPPRGAAATLKSYVSRLRPALGGRQSISGTRDGYRLDVDPTMIDLRRFERDVAAGRAAVADKRWQAAERVLDAAIARWRGRPFGQLGDLPALQHEATRLGDLRLEALELRGELRLATGRAAELIDELETLVAAHPYRERLWRLLMLALYHGARQADALAAYHRARTALDEELGIEPGPELRELEAAILRQDVAPIEGDDTRETLPSPITSFVGRTAELEEILGRLTTHRLVTITGVGGVGKTRLGIEAARLAGDSFPDGVTFVDLAPLADADLVVARIAATYDLRELPGTSLTDRIAAHLRDRAALLVLDNCEHLREACATFIAGVLAAAPNIRILATSREVLAVPGESIFATPPLADAEAVQLFLARARDARPNLRDDDATVAVVGRICADLDGLPLGIELAAAHARALTPTDIAARLDNRFQFLASWRRFGPARHRTLRAAIDWSYELLEPEASRLLDRLSVFAGGFTLDSVAAVGTDGDEAAALELLERLVDASLVTADPDADPVRYRLLETIRQYAADRLTEEGDATGVRDRHAEHFARLATEAEGPLRRTAEAPAWIRRLAGDAENLRTALRWSRERGDFDRILRIVNGAWWFWWMRGETREARAWCEVGLEGATGSDPLLRARVLLASAGLAWAQGDGVTAERDGTAALRLFVEIGDVRGEASALNTLGLTAHRRDDLRTARERFEASLAAYRREGEPEGARALSMATTIDNLGSVAFEQGDTDAALPWYEEARTVNRRWGDETVMNDLHIAHIYALRGRHAEARELLAGALRWYGERGWYQYVAECLESASICANALGESRSAARFLGAADAMRTEAGTPAVSFLARTRDRELGLARVAIGDDVVAAAFAEGQRLSLEEAVAATLEFLEA